MGLSTVAVAVGILGEYVAHFIFEKEARDNKREMVVSILFGVLVLGGVVGEYIFGKKLSQVSEQLQQIADTEVAQSNRDAAAARKDAELARTQSAATYERAAQAEQHASQENARAAKALEAAEVARKNAEGFRLQIAQANERAANAERETARLTQRLADRSLSDAQVRAMTLRLLPFSGQEVVVVTYDSKETVGLANKLIAAITLAGWKYIPQNGVMIGGISGVLVFYHPKADAKAVEAANTLVSALNERGIEAAIRLENPNNPISNRLEMSVGTKP
jgi:hypothetical protein